MSSYDYLYNLQLQQFVQQLYATNLLLAQNPADFYRYHDPVSALGMQGDQLTPGLYLAPQPLPLQDVPAAAPAPTVQDIAPVQLFRGEKETRGEKKSTGKIRRERLRKKKKILLEVAASAQKTKVEMESVPDELSHLPDGENFLQLQTPDLHLYYSEKVIAVPILYAIARRKNFATYTTIFSRLKEVIGEHRLRIVLDFEKAAIRAAKEAFPDAVVQGCAFHLAQALNRMAEELRLRRFIRGKKRVRAVFFPRKQMLSRRTNPPFDELLESLHALNTEALGKLLFLQENVHFSKPLRRRDRIRRQKITEAMADFRNTYEAGTYITTDTINEYYRTMSRYVTEKTI
ncbi:hypothetical protein Y032_0039g108 [Ancylostoma ceylanicum]|uniref:MULE transposase domain-containing protein n=1 Tax=Ancylostoma ceylanicum TaxID=53326 RepID=A0A016UII4_9BILA|nr:hypothetical protein Y032_0039g108 [Ancylostoma ceylanicum]